MVTPASPFLLQFARRRLALFFEAGAHRVEPSGRAELFVFARDEVGVLFYENFSGWAKIELFGMIAEEFAVHAYPDKPSIRVDVDLGHAEFRRGQVFLFIYTTRGGIKLPAGSVYPFDLRFRNAG